MKTRAGKTALRIGLGLLLVLAISVAYNVVDNQRFVLVEQEITIARLPASFDGFRILQISDLHGKTFGEKQVDLIQAINRIDYDMIAFTGDMNDSTAAGDAPQNAQAVLDLLDGIANKEAMFWVDGNTGPYATQGYQDLKSGGFTAIGSLLHEKGVRVLLLPHAITRGADKIWITPEMSEILFGMHQSFLTDERLAGAMENVAPYQAFHERAFAAFQVIQGNGEVKIMLSHAPKQTNATAEERALHGDLDYDLILAGHYHGGQLRLPLIGAVYIPSPTSGINNSGFFPAQDQVKGISYYGDVPQYVSAGLGASGHVRLARFRMFNTPEINLITLRQK